jgi:carbon storage regulator
MLILSRKPNQSIIIDGRIIIKVLRIERDTVKLGIQAPSDVVVHRQEVYDAIQRAKQAAEGQAPPASGQAQGPTAQPPPTGTSPGAGPGGRPNQKPSAT